jgi:hypothetical protein
MGTSLPLTTVDGASRLALCVKNLAGRAHLQLSARIGGGRVQSIGGAIRGRGSGHGGTDGARVSSVGGTGIVVVGAGAIGGGERATGSRGESSAGHSMRRRVRGQGAIVLPERSRTALGKCLQEAVSKSSQRSSALPRKLIGKLKRPGLRRKLVSLRRRSWSGVIVAVARCAVQCWGSETGGGHRYSEERRRGS